MVDVVVPLAQQLARADAAVLRLAAVVVPRPRSEVDGVAGVVHGHVDVVVAVVLVGGGALGAVCGEDVSWTGWRAEDGIRVGLPVAAAELVGLAESARKKRACGDGGAQGDDGGEEGCGVHGDWFENDV